MRRMIALFVVALLPLPVFAQSATARTEHHGDHRSTLTVTGNGEVSAKPDRAIVRLGVEAEGKDAATVQNEINEKMQAVLNAEKQLGIEESQIQTATLSLNAVMRNDSGSVGGTYKDRVTGYQGTQIVRIQFDDLSRIGPAVDAGIKAGANRLDGVLFELKNDTKARNAALAAAADQAHSTAQALAAALGLHLDGIEEVNEGVPR